MGFFPVQGATLGVEPEQVQRTPNKKGKGMFLYSAVSGPWDCSFRALNFTPWQTCSIQRHIDFSGKHSAMLQLLHEDRYPHMSVARYSFIQLNELWQCGMN